jgi:peptide/nickel transport system ATP-binding protein
MIWITHDLAVVSSLADRIAVMYAGRIVETGATADVVSTPRHPYTRGLINSVPSHNARGSRLAQIPGMTPSLINLPQGCAFRLRCPQAIDACLERPPIREIARGREVRCFNPVGAAQHAAAEGAA